MANLTTKVRKNDWVSIEKAIRQLSSEANVTYGDVKVNNITIVADDDGNYGGAYPMIFENVDDSTARLALEGILGRVCYQVDEGTAWLYTTY